jgi:phage/plasmid-like protein (TIGR03299 family)
VGSGYEPVQNRGAFDFFDMLVDGHGAMYESAGIVGHGERIWLLASLPGYIKVHCNDLVHKYLLLINSHDGTVPIRVKITPVRVVCSNTLTSALQGVGEVHIHHTRNAVKKMEQALALLKWSDSAFDRLGAVFNRMAATRATGHQLREYVHTLIPDGKEAESEAGTGNIRNEVLRLHDSGRGAYLSRGTWWGAFNSVTEYTDHAVYSGTPAAQLHSIWFGRGEQLKVKAFRLAELMMQA